MRIGENAVAYSILLEIKRSENLVAPFLNLKRTMFYDIFYTSNNEQARPFLMFSPGPHSNQKVVSKMLHFFSIGDTGIH